MNKIRRLILLILLSTTSTSMQACSGGAGSADATENASNALAGCMSGCKRIYARIQRFFDFEGYLQFRKDFPDLKNLTDRQIGQLRFETDWLQTMVDGPINQYQSQFCLIRILNMLEIVEQMPVDDKKARSHRENYTLVGRYLGAQEIELAYADPFGHTLHSLARKQTTSVDDKAPTQARAKDLLKVLGAAGVKANQVTPRPSKFASIGLSAFMAAFEASQTTVGRKKRRTKAEL